MMVYQVIQPVHYQEIVLFPITLSDLNPLLSKLGTPGVDQGKPQSPRATVVDQGRQQPPRATGLFSPLCFPSPGSHQNLLLGFSYQCVTESLQGLNCLNRHQNLSLNGRHFDSVISEHSSEYVNGEGCLPWTPDLISHVPLLILSVYRVNLSTRSKI